MRIRHDIFAAKQPTQIKIREIRDSRAPLFIIVGKSAEGTTDRKFSEKMFNNLKITAKSLLNGKLFDFPSDFPKFYSHLRPSNRHFALNILVTSPADFQ